jgi:hypothetical protein
MPGLQSLGADGAMINNNQALTDLFFEISALQPENDSAQAAAAYFHQIAQKWFQVAALMAAESEAADELVLKYRWALEDAGIDPLRVVN